MVGAFALAALWGVEAVAKRGGLQWRNGLHWPVLALLGWAAVATAASLNPRLSLLGAYKSYDGLYATVAFGVVFFAMAQAFRLHQVKLALSVLYFAGGGLVVLYGLIQLHDRTWSGPRWDWIRWGETSFTGASIWSTLGNPNHLAGFLAVILPIGVVLALLYRSWWVRALIAAIAAVAVLELLQTTTRGAWLATVVAFLALAALMVPEIKRHPKVAASLAGGLVVAVVVAGMALGSTRNLGAQLGSAFKFGDNSTAVQRVELWKTAVRIASDRPLVGTGPDGYRIFFTSLQSPKFVRLYGPDQIANGPHNVFMNYLSTQGYPALVAFVGLLGLAALRAVGSWRRVRRIEANAEDGFSAQGREARLVLAGVVVALLAYVVQATFNTQ
ncbi:MAG TPA: O-antigen ligase family protein, partial [bacterium]|nr:O-antigen ligase family protein [bacterium]